MNSIFAASCSLRTWSRSARYGLMNEVSAITPASTKSFAASPMRRMFSVRSSAVKPRFLLRPMRMLSPSSRYDRCPCSCRYDSSATAIVLLPLPDNPVNQIVAPFCLSNWLRCSRVISPSCQCTLVAFCSVISGLSLFGGLGLEGDQDRVAIEGLAGADVDRLDHRVARGRNCSLHLHAFHHQQW